MPRLLPRLFRQAKRLSSNVAALLPACRDLQSAQNELRWLTQHAQGDLRRLARLCRQRGSGFPLQYILGSQPFGSLEIRCKPGVLIPRPETEAFTCHLAHLLKTGQILNGIKSLSIIDLCTGTGCIPLLLFASLQEKFSRLVIRGLDLAPDAVRLARLNIKHNERLANLATPCSGQALQILTGDVFCDKRIKSLATGTCDILTSNPPYVSQKAWDYGHGQLGYSVRKYEPRLALVPSSDLSIPSGWKRQDVFYARLLDVIAMLRPKVVLLELGDEAQARRVLVGLSRHAIATVAKVEVWRDWPDSKASVGEDNELSVTAGAESLTVRVRGSGQIRSFFMQLDWNK